MPSLPADGTQWSLGAQEAAEPDVHEPTSWEGAGATDDPNTIVVRDYFTSYGGGRRCESVWRAAFQLSFAWLSSRSQKIWAS